LTRLVARIDGLQRKFKEDGSIYGRQESTSEARGAASGGKQSIERILDAEPTKFDGYYIMKFLHGSDTLKPA